MAVKKAVASDVTVRYHDGTEATARLGIRELVEMERHWPLGIVPALESTLFMAWWAFGKPGDKSGANGDNPNAAFERWIDTVASIEDEEVELTPTEPAVGDA